MLYGPILGRELAIAALHISGLSMRRPVVSLRLRERFVRRTALAAHHRHVATHQLVVDASLRNGTVAASRLAIVAGMLGRPMRGQPLGAGVRFVTVVALVLSRRCCVVVRLGGRLLVFGLHFHGDGGSVDIGSTSRSAALARWRRVRFCIAVLRGLLHFDIVGKGDYSIIIFDIAITLQSAGVRIVVIAIITQLWHFCIGRLRIRQQIKHFLFTRNCVWRQRSSGLDVLLVQHQHRLVELVEVVSFGPARLAHETAGIAINA